MAYDIYKDPNIVQDLGGGKFKRKDGKVVDKYGVVIKQGETLASTPKPKFNLFDFQTKVAGTNVNKVIPTTTAIATRVEPKNNVFTPSSPASMVKPVKPTTPTATAPTPTTGIPGIPTASADYSGMNLFKDEVEAYSKMKSDGLSEEEANALIKNRRQDLMKGNTKLSQSESRALLKMQQDGLTANEAVKLLEDYRKNKPVEEKKTSIAREIFNIPVGARALATEQVGNVLDFVTMGKFGFGEDVAKLKEENKDLEGSFGYNTGRNILGTGEMIATGPTKLAKTLLGRTAQGAMVGGITGAGMPILEKGNQATMGDIATGGAIGGTIGAVATPLLEKVAIPAVSGIVSKTMKYGKAGIQGGIKGVGKSIGEDIKGGIIKPFQKSAQDKAGSIALGGIINPAKLDAVKKGLMVDEGIATPEDVGKWMLNRIKPGNKQDIAEQLIKHSETSKKAVDDTLIKIKDTFENESAKKALTQIYTDLDGRVGFEDDLLRIEKLLGKDKYTLTELNAVKREMDNIYNIYKQSGEVSASLNAQGLNKVRQNIRKFIEDEASKYGVDIKKLNNETSVARGLAEGILKKDNADSVREMLSAFAPSGVGSIIGAGQSIAQGNDPWIVLRDTLIGGATAKLLTSTKARTIIADKINKLGPKEMTALENFIKSGGTDAVGRKVAEQVVKIKGLLGPGPIITPAPKLKSNIKVTSAKVQPNVSRGLLALPEGRKSAIVTPQTMEKGVIQESKIPLKNTKYGTNNPNSNSSNNPNILLTPPTSDKGKTILKPKVESKKPRVIK